MKSLGHTPETSVMSIIPKLKKSQTCRDMHNLKEYKLYFKHAIHVIPDYK